MKTSEFQHSTPREIPNPIFHPGTTRWSSSAAHPWSLKLGPSMALGIWCLVLFFAQEAGAQNYSVDWYKMSGGGGTSTGGGYALSGTIGQPDAGTLNGGIYTLQGGFWPGIVVPSVGPAPTLFIQSSGSSVVISWSPVTPGFGLEATGDLSSPAWSSVSGSSPVTIPINATGRFYRLKQP